MYWTCEAVTVRPSLFLLPNRTHCLGAEMAGTSHLMSAQLGWARVRDDSASAESPLGAI